MADSSGACPRSAAVSLRQSRLASRSAVFAPIPAIGVMLWMASPSSVTLVVGQGLTGAMLRIRTGATVAGSDSATIRSRAGCQPRIIDRVSLCKARPSLPSCLRVTAVSADDDEIMAVEHREHPVSGVQFHPESAATEYGYWILDRFIRGDAARTRDWSTGADGLDSDHPKDTPAPFVPPSVELVR